MVLIGLCGRSGSGKSTVAGFWKSFGVNLIDADRVCHYVYSENALCVEELCGRFGNDVAAFGSILRPVLAKRAYSTEGGIEALNRIAHKYILEEIENRLKRAEEDGVPFTVIDAPLLFESGLDKRCDIVTAVISSDIAQISRLEKRDGKSAAELKERLSAQLSEAELLKRCQCLVLNNGSLAQLRRRAYLALFYIQLKLKCLHKGEKGRFYVKKQL